MTKYNIPINVQNWEEMIQAVIESMPLEKLLENVWFTYSRWELSKRVRPRLDGKPTVTRGLTDSIMVLPEAGKYIREIADKHTRLTVGSKNLEVKLLGPFCEEERLNPLDLDHSNLYFFVGSEEEKRQRLSQTHIDQLQLFVTPSLEVIIYLGAYKERKMFKNYSVQHPIFRGMFTHHELFKPFEDPILSLCNKAALTYFFSDITGSHILKASYCILCASDYLIEMVDKNLLSLGFKKEAEGK